MIIRKSLTAVGTIALAVGVASCSSDDSSSASDTSTSAASTSTGTSAAAAAAPSAAELQATLVTFFDPAVGTTEKAALVEDGTSQAAVLEQFNGVLQGYPLTAEVTKVTAVDDDTVSATTTIAGPHGGAASEVVFDQVDGKWVISEDAACTIFSMGKLTCVK
ncbi:nuclear transport factor 2 family protein [Rhodococcus maanshanensis]|uniref:nuclear transport factor 2 family protein n=1 Tax=Rhodococcus maanshanensis TaxID=183556 RepID=UPI0022B331DD|nr:nuclear transport factor 2 family protein [Rhodococcus maanshanensis]MCZ4558998.1 nuclear transport factor 2 family protein [Rhodococcus maanshanensis]